MSNSPPSPAQIKPDDQRPEHPDFWCKRFVTGATPWDSGKTPDRLAEFMASQPAPRPTLIPGCGSGWEAASLSQHGWPVTALDFSPAAAARARTLLAGMPVNVVCADFFAWQPAQELRAGPICLDRISTAISGALRG